MVYEISNKTPIERKSGKVKLNCAVCGLGFERHAAWAKKAANHYCGVACRIEGSKEQVDTNCVYCGNGFQLKRSNLSRVTTCSRRCSQLRRIKHTDKPRVRIDAIKHRAKIADPVTNCGKCQVLFEEGEVKEVEGLEVTIHDDGVTLLFSGNPVVVCRACHMETISPLGVQAKESKRDAADRSSESP